MANLADTSLCVMPAAIKHDKIVVVFDLCSSSQIMEDLLLSDRFDHYEAFLTCVKRWLMNWSEQHSQVRGQFELYKFMGDGWVLLFPATIHGKALVNSMYNLCEMINAELARHIIPSLSSMPAILGATLGVERGNLVRMMMNEQAEYVGRALNVACRLQGAVKEKESTLIDERKLGGSCYKAFVSAHLYNERLGQLNMPYKVEDARSPLRNILSGSGFACREIDFTVDRAGQALPWPERETQGGACARSNWESPP